MKGGVEKLRNKKVSKNKISLKFARQYLVNCKSKLFEDEMNSPRLKMCLQNSL